MRITESLCRKKAKFNSRYDDSCIKINFMVTQDANAYKTLQTLSPPHLPVRQINDSSYLGHVVKKVVKPLV